MGTVTAGCDVKMKRGRSFGANAGGPRACYTTPMAWTHWALLGVAVMLVAYAAAVVVLMLAGRRADARALAGFIPDCVGLVHRLVGDPRVPRRRKLLLLVLVAYLAMPIDLVPDFIPGAGQLRDAIVAALVLRAVLRAGGEPLLEEHWRGPAQSRELVRRLAFGGA